MMAQGGVLFKFILVLYKFILLMGQGGVLFKFILALYKFILLKGRAFSQYEVLFDWDIMRIGESDDPEMLNIRLNGDRMEVVDSFKYLI